MSEILAAAQTLADAISGSGEYADYRKSRIRVMENPDVAEKLFDFKKKQAAVELRRLQNQIITFDEEKQLSHQYAELSLNETAGRFLECEDVFLGLYNRALELINGACEIDVIL